MIKFSELVSGLATGGDDAPRWMAAIAKVGNNAAIELDPLPYQFKTPCVISQRKGITLWSGCNPVPDGDDHVGFGADRDTIREFGGFLQAVATGGTGSVNPTSVKGSIEAYIASRLGARQDYR